MDAAIAVANETLSKDSRLIPIFSLAHLGHITGTGYSYLRDVVKRKHDGYRVFKINKVGAPDDSRFRMICVPEPILMHVQRWIHHNVLSFGKPHRASAAYVRGSSVYKAAEQHCGCRWIVKMDVTRFFESINEISVYRTFRHQFGYQPLVAFELARICTRLGPPTKARRVDRFRRHRLALNAPYQNDWMGHLPQGAPTSPALSNLCMLDFDKEVQAFAQSTGMAYTRYADDIVLSAGARSFDRNDARRVIGEVFAIMGCYGLSPNAAKTQIVSPGSRKVVHGLLVDGEQPRLTREFRLSLRQHLYYLGKGVESVSRHATKRKFSSVIGMRNHIRGKISYASQVDPAFGAKCLADFNKVHWPL